MQKIKKYIPAVLFLTPFFALAVSDIQELSVLIRDILGNYVIPVLFAIALVVFLWGVVQYITAGGDEEKRKSGKQTMIWGIVGLFVMVAVWGLVNLLWYTLDLDVNAPDYPQF